MFFHHQVIRTAGTGGSFADRFVQKIKGPQGRTQCVIQALTAKHLEIPVNVNPLGSSSTVPALPVIESLIVQPIGIHPVLAPVCQCDLTIIVFVISPIFQDSSPVRSCVYLSRDIACRCCLRCEKSSAAGRMLHSPGFALHARVRP